MSGGGSRTLTGRDMSGADGRILHRQRYVRRRQQDTPQAEICPEQAAERSQAEICPEQAAERSQAEICQEQAAGCSIGRNIPQEAAGDSRRHHR